MRFKHTVDRNLAEECAFKSKNLMGMAENKSQTYFGLTNMQMRINAIMCLKCSYV